MGHIHFKGTQERFHSLTKSYFWRRVIEVLVKQKSDCKTLREYDEKDHRLSLR